MMSASIAKHGTTRRTASGVATSLGPLQQAQPTAIRKRRLGVLVACNACRKRKTACDGSRPVCGTCASRGNIRCEYDTSNSTESRLAALRRESECLKLQNESLKRENEALKDPLAQTNEVLLRQQPMPIGSPMQPYKCEKVPPIPPGPLAFISNENAYTNLGKLDQSNPHSLASKSLDDFGLKDSAKFLSQYPLLGSLGVLQDSTPYDYVLRAGTVEDCQVARAYDERMQNLDISYWTTVPITAEFAAIVISCFLTTQHPILGFFDANLFKADLVAKKNTHCSSLLVNALLYVSMLEHTTLHVDASSLKPLFSAEAEKNWLLENRRATLPTLSALNLLGFGCICDGDNKQGDQYFLHSRIVSEDIGLFSKSVADAQPRHAKDSLAAEAHAAWGLFAFHTMKSFYFRDGLPRSAPLLPIPEPDCRTIRKASGSGEDTFKVWCELWRIMHPVAKAYCSAQPDSPIELPLPLAESQYGQLMKLTRDLPASMVRSPSCSHQAMVFHMYLQAAVLDIFRPFLGSNLRLYSSFTMHSSPETAFFASLGELKSLAFTYQASYPEARSTFEWNHACFYIANAVIHDINDQDWRSCFELCLQCYAVLSRSYGSAWQFICGFIAMAVKVRNLPMSEALRFLRGIGTQRQIPLEASCLRVVFDQKKALTNARVAQMNALLEEFHVSAVMDDFVDSSILI